MPCSRRRAVSMLSAVIAAPRMLFAQMPERRKRLCWLSGAALRTEAYNVAFVDELGKLGFVEGKNLLIEFRNAHGRAEQLAQLAAELARSGCDAFLSTGSEPNLNAVKKASGATPIVMVAIDYDPVERGYIASLAHPGGNITGVHQLQTALAEKRIEILHELLPKAQRIGVLADIATAETLGASRNAAKRYDMELAVHEFRAAPYDYDSAIASLAANRVDALLPLPSGFFVPGRKRITELALKYRLPAIYNNYIWADAGGLISYGTNLSEMYRRAAGQMAKVLNGAKPADLPVEQPTVVEMVINMRTAKALGLTIPQGIWFRAERVIE